MRKLNLFAATLGLASATLVAPVAVQAQAYGDGPAPAYAAAGAHYAPYGYDEEDGGRHKRGFELVGARAGVTVLGVNLDGSAGVRLSVGDGGGHRRRRVEAPDYAPEPVYAPQYEPQYEPAYPPMPAPPTYGYPPPPPCGCQPYGW